MRKILYSSVALIASCGVAAAEVSVGGDASIGIKFTEGSDNELTIAHNVDLNLTLSGQTDGGLSFGASVTITNAQGVDLTTETADNSTDPVSLDTTQTVTVIFGNTVDLGNATVIQDADGKSIALTSATRNIYFGADSESTDTPDYIVDTIAAVPAEADKTFDKAEYTVRITTNYDSTEPNVNTTAGRADTVVTVGGITYYNVDVKGASGSVYWQDTGGSWFKAEKKASVEELTTLAKGKDQFSVSTLLGTNPVNVTESEVDIEGITERNSNLADAEDAVAAAPPTRSTDYTVTFTDTDTNTDTDSVVTSASLQNKAVVYISGGFGKISVGDISAADSAASGIADVGYDGLGVDDIAESLRGKSDAEVLYEFSAAGVSIGVSGSTKRGSDSGFALGVKYSLDPISFGIGYADEGGTATVSAGIGATLGDVSTNLMYSSKDGGDNAVGMDASFKASENMTVTISGANSEIGGEDKQAYGIGLTFDLGGGASVGTGFASVDGTAKGDLGLNLEF